MEKEAFIKFCSDFWEANKHLEDDLWSALYAYHGRNWMKSEESKDDGFMRAVSPGGVRGGSCWESSNPLPYVNDDVDRTFHLLNKFLEKYAETIPFLIYQRILQRVETWEAVLGEYYGNYTNYEIQYLSFEDLWNELGEDNIRKYFNFDA